MATGALYAGVCYLSQETATDAFYAKSAPAFTANSTSYLSMYQKESGAWKVKQWSIDSVGAHTLMYDVTAESPTFPECDPSETFFDGMTIGWGIAAALVAVACIKLMQRAAA